MTTPKPNWPLLGGLRFVLALIVACCHMAVVLPGTMTGYFAAAEPMMVCVTAFFIISGFSVCASYSKEPEGFLRRRAFRILPLYYLGVALTGLPWLVWGPVVKVPGGGAYGAPPMVQVVKYLLLLQPALGPVPFFNMALWSLPLEAYCYLIGPVLMRHSRFAIPIFAISAGFFAMADLTISKPLNLAVAVGMLWPFMLGWLFYRVRENTRVKLAIQVLLPYLLFLYFWRIGSNNWGAIPFAALIMWLIANQEKVRLTASWVRVLNYLGDLSFPLYIVHYPIGWMFLIGSPAKYFAFGLATSFLAAVFALHLIDRPLRSLGRRAAARGLAAGNA